MLSFGKNLTASGPDSLELIAEDRLVALIRQATPEVKELVANIRQVVAVNPKAAANLKRKLPFFVGARFENNWRKLEYFEEAEYLVIDIDHCFESEEQFGDLRERLANDMRVLMLFVSPGGQGLKLMFRLAEPARDTQQFANFYQAFSKAFAVQYGLEDHVDFKTHDATRLCFLSDDPYATYNPLAEELRLADYVSPYERLPEPEGSPEVVVETGVSLPNQEGAEVYREIRKKLNPAGRVPLKPMPFVPEILLQVVDPISQAFQKQGFEVKEVRDISFGKKWLVEHGVAKGEINVYYGKRGFSIVKSSKTGTNGELNDLLEELAHRVIYDLERRFLEGRLQMGFPATDAEELPF